jgi:hypothetical protein
MRVNADNIKATATIMHPNNYQTDGDANANILTFDGGGIGTGSCFGMPGDEDADTMRAVQSSIAGGVGGDAVEAGDVDVE